MSTRYASVLQRLIDTVEGNLTTSLDLDHISGASGLSKFHLVRLFRSLTGLSVMEYVRNRRLTTSLGPLLESNRSVLEIALETGFGYEQSFIRAFARLFGTTPGSYRRNRPVVDSCPPLTPGVFEPLGEHAVLISPRHVFLPEITLCGVKHRVDLAQNEAGSTVTQLASEFWAGRRREIKATQVKNQYWGVVEYSGSPGWNWYRTTARLEPAEGGSTRGPAPAGMAYFVVPPDNYAAFTIVARCNPRALTWKDLAPAYDRIFDVWAPEFGDPFGTPWHLEFVDDTVSRHDYGEFTLFFPRRK